MPSRLWLGSSRHWMVEIEGRRFVFETIFDVTARKKPEEALLERDRELHAIVDLTPFLRTRCSRPTAKSPISPRKKTHFRCAGWNL